MTWEVSAGRLTAARRLGQAGGSRSYLETGNREETTMHPALQHDLMQARHDDMLRAAGRRRLAAHAATARRARRDDTAAAPRRRVLRLVWRLQWGA